MKNLMVVSMLVFNLGCSVFGQRTVEELKYELIQKEEKYEIRSYPSHIVAQVSVENSDNPENKAFKLLAGYIFGKNKSKSEISMTAPVLMASDEEKKMTMIFSMPSKYSMQELPEPNDTRIKLATVSQQFMAALVFSGFWGKEKNEKLAEDLKKWLVNHPEYKQISKPFFAGYNPPWTLPFLRRNEILIKLEKLDLKNN